MTNAPKKSVAVKTFQRIFWMFIILTAFAFLLQNAIYYHAEETKDMFIYPEKAFVELEKQAQNYVENLPKDSNLRNFYFTLDSDHSQTHDISLRVNVQLVDSTIVSSTMNRSIDTVIGYILITESIILGLSAFYAFGFLVILGLLYVLIKFIKLTIRIIRNSKKQTMSTIDNESNKTDQQPIIQNQSTSQQHTEQTSANQNPTQHRSRRT